MSIFNEISVRKPSFNTFDLSHDKKLSLKMGQLVPIHLQEIIPGDKIKMSTSQMVRLAPMLAPVMHRVNIYTHFYFVPNRLLWDNWEGFITGGEDGLNESVFPTLSIDMGDCENGGLSDYFGLPIQQDAAATVSALPFAAYNKIYNEYYRDQNLIDPLPDTLSDGNNSVEYFDTYTGDPQRRAWAHDYFTSALPWTQKGAEATIPIGDRAPLVWESPNPLDGDDVRVPVGTPAVNAQLTSNAGKLANEFGSARNIDVTDTTYADLSAATASSINDLRRAFKLQEWLEKNARGGSRYIESILSHFGVRSSDARLQRPEFLGGGTSPITISEVLQTSEAPDQNTPQGNMAGHGISMGANNAFSYRSEEHGYIVGIMSIMPKAAYQQGIDKHFLKFDKFDYFWPSFAHLGEQPIQNQELFLNEIPDDHEATFGYTPRYAEYKHINSSVHGEFRTSLDFWHMGRIFDNLPALNADFINCDPTTRIFAVLDTETVYAHIFHRIKASRPMPYFGTPTL